MINTHDTPTARLLLHSFRNFEQFLIKGLYHHKFTDITPSHLNVLRHLNKEGLTLTQLAGDAEMSKQAAGKISRDLAAKGYLKILDDKNDGRTKKVIYTTRGAKLIKTAVEIAIEAEEQYIKTLGESQYHSLRNMLEKIIPVLT